MEKPSEIRSAFAAGESVVRRGVHVLSGWTTLGISDLWLLSFRIVRMQAERTFNPPCTLFHPSSAAARDGLDCPMICHSTPSLLFFQSFSLAFIPAKRDLPFPLSACSLQSAWLTIEPAPSCASPVRKRLAILFSFSSFRLPGSRPPRSLVKVSSSTLHTFSTSSTSLVSSSAYPRTESGSEVYHLCFCFPPPYLFFDDLIICLAGRPIVSHYLAAQISSFHHRRPPILGRQTLPHETIGLVFVGLHVACRSC